MNHIPERNWSDPLGGLGVVGREGIGVADRDMTPFSLLSLPVSEDLSISSISVSLKVSQL
jgi:hypothetical protein